MVAAGGAWRQGGRGWRRAHANVTPHASHCQLSTTLPSDVIGSCVLSRRPQLHAARAALRQVDLHERLLVHEPHAGLALRRAQLRAARVCHRPLCVGGVQGPRGRRRGLLVNATRCLLVRVVVAAVRVRCVTVCGARLQAACEMPQQLCLSSCASADTWKDLRERCGRGWIGIRLRAAKQ